MESKMNLPEPSLGVSSAAQKKKLIILGGGFAGINFYTDIYKQKENLHLDIKLISNKSYFLFTPLLHEAAAGKLSPNSLTQKMDEIVNKSDFLEAQITSINLNNKTLSDTNGTTYPFDYLVIATGATTNFYNTPGAEKYTQPLKNFKDALEISSKLQHVMEGTKEPQIVIIGAGPTSIEVATEIASHFRNTACTNKAITIINRAAKPMESFPLYIQATSMDALQNKHINVINNFTITEITQNDIIGTHDEKQKTIPYNLAIWAAGVKPNYPLIEPQIEVDPQQRIIVNETLQLPNHPNVFVIGDSASIKTNENKTVPMLAQAAVAEAQYLSNNFKNLIDASTDQNIKKFEFKPTGMLLSLGRFEAAGQIGPLKISGICAWFIWRTIYLFNFKSWKKRLLIALEWTRNLFE